MAVDFQLSTRRYLPEGRTLLLLLLSSSSPLSLISVRKTCLPPIPTLQKLAEPVRAAIEMCGGNCGGCAVGIESRDTHNVLLPVSLGGTNTGILSMYYVDEAEKKC
jgi:hypothetical protein